jgi:hypothetical protein
MVDIDHPAVRSVVSNCGHHTVPRGDHISSRIKGEIHPLVERGATREGRNSIAVVRGDITLCGVPYRQRSKPLRDRSEPSKEITLGRCVRALFGRRLSFEGSGCLRFEKRWPYLK